MSQAQEAEVVLTEDTAASKIQALHRGRAARQQVKQKRDKETAAAVKIQALQRGRTSRQRVQQLTTVFPDARPVNQSSTHVDVRVSIEALRHSIRTWADFQKYITEADALSNALVAPLGGGTSSEEATNVAPVSATPVAAKGAAAASATVITAVTAAASRTVEASKPQVFYSTAAAPHSFANVFDDRVLAKLVEYERKCRAAEKLRADNEAILAKRAADAAAAAAAAPPPPSPPKAAVSDEDGGADEGAEADATPKKSKKQLKEEAAQRKADRERLQAVLTAEYERDLLKSKLANVLAMTAMRLPLDNY